MRTECITYSIKKKKASRLVEDYLVRDIARLESKADEAPDADTLEILERKEKELEEVRKPYIEGIAIRSRARWYEQSEKSTKYFLGLEKRNFLSKVTAAAALDNNAKSA